MMRVLAVTWPVVMRWSTTRPIQQQPSYSKPSTPSVSFLSCRL